LAETHPLTWRLRDDKQPVWLEEYESKNGYAGARKALGAMAPDEIVNAVKDAGLKGRGGAGFSTSRISRRVQNVLKSSEKNRRNSKLRSCVKSRPQSRSV
jgi:NADH-quinone oxidoreductase subunit F